MGFPKVEASGPASGVPEFIAAVRSWGDSALSSNPVFVFDIGKKFTKEKIAVSDLPVGGIDVETGFRLRRDDEKIPDFMLLAKVFHQIPSPRLEQGLLVVAQTMQVIKDGIALAGMLGRVVTRGQHDTVMNALAESAAVQRVAVDAALTAGSRAKQSE